MSAVILSTNLFWLKTRFRHATVTLRSSVCSLDGVCEGLEWVFHLATHIFDAKVKEFELATY